jgi:hypothetical protein
MVGLHEGYQRPGSGVHSAGGRQNSALKWEKIRLIISISIRNVENVQGPIGPVNPLSLKVDGATIFVV